MQGLFMDPITTLLLTLRLHFLEYSSVLNATLVTNAFLSYCLLSICFSFDDVLGKHVGPSLQFLTFQFQFELYFHLLRS